MSDGRNSSGLMADSAGLGRDVRLAHWVDCEWESSGKTVCVSGGGVRGGGLSSDAEPSRTPPKPVASAHRPTSDSENYSRFSCANKRLVYIIIVVIIGLVLLCPNVLNKRVL